MNYVLSATGNGDRSWRRVFADELIRLRPDLNPDAADELSDAAFLRHADLEPSQTAQLFCRAAGGLSAPAQDSPARDPRRHA